MHKPSVFRLAKDGSTQAEYEDAIGWSSRRGRFAVADGASASAFARLWAHLLVQAYTGGKLSANSLEADLEPLQARWSQLVEQRDLPWYAVEQTRRGAFAALIGLTLSDAGRWSALAVGDCCMFQVRDAELVTAMPICSIEAFDNRPLLIGSRTIANHKLRDQNAIILACGRWEPGDVFLLMSDALAESFLRLSHEVAPLEVLAFKRTASGFRRWVHQQRLQRTLRNDDVSLLWVSIPADAAA